MARTDKMQVLVKVTLMLIVLSNGISAEELKDPCETTDEVPDLGTRLPDITADHGSDSHITKRWYTAGHFLDMATHIAPGKRGCGSEEQCWMKDKMPSKEQGETFVEVCVASVFKKNNNCYTSFFIKVKNCGKYRVYKLEPTALSTDGAARYCFEPQGLSADPAPTFRPSNVQILTEMMLYDATRYEIKFLCNFTEEPKLFYSALFYVDDKLIVIKSVQFKEEAFVLESELSDLDEDYKMGITIACSVSAKISNNGRMGPRERSADTYAGLKIEDSPAIQIPRGGRHTIKLRPTVPIGCSNAACTINIYLINSVATFDDHLDCHTNGIDNFQKCSIGIQGGTTKEFFDNKEWDKVYEYEIETFDDQRISYELQRTNFKFQFKMVPKRHHQFWDGLSESVTVNVYDDNVDGSLWKKKNCRIFCDPHMKTFDGMAYELQKAGEYLAFKHETLPMQVQIKSKSCGHNHRAPFCICGLSVVVGKAVFMLDTCSRSAPEARFLSCGGKDELRVVEHDNMFEFHLPTGATVQAKRAYRNFWNIVITPTVHEIRKTSALCGSLDGNRCNDCIHRNGRTQCSNHPPGDHCSGSHSFHPNDFTSSYLLRTDENLFLDDYSTAVNNLEEYPSSAQLCFCPFDDKGLRDPEDDTKSYAKSVCGYRKFSSCQETRHDVKCKIHTVSKKKIRKKRASPELSISSGSKPEHFFKDIRKRDTLTETEARRICTTTMNGSPTLTDCNDMSLSTSSTEIEYCVLDLLATGNMVWASDAMDRASQSCLQEVHKNRTVRTIHPESAVIVQNFTCQNNCSNQGVCSNGECTCNEGFAAADCSVDLSTPPNVNSLDLGDDQVCDRKDECDEVFINGGDFPYDRNYTCNFEMFHVYNNGSKTRVGDSDVQGYQRNIFQVTCPLVFVDSEEATFVLEYEVKVKMDENDFSSGLQFVILNSTCQDYTIEEGKYTYFIKTGYCFINGECFAEGHTEVNNSRRCQPNTHLYSWTDISDIAERKKEGGDGQTDNGYVIWIAVGCCVLVVAIVIAVGIIVKRKMTSSTGHHVVALSETPANEDPLLGTSFPCESKEEEDVVLKTLTSLS